MMTIIENTGKKPTCPVCKSSDYWDCGHLVADLDRTFHECQGGELYERIAEFSELVENAFLAHLTEKTVPNLEKWELDQLWETASERFDPDEEYVALDGDVFQRVLIELLEDCGAFELPEGLIDPGGPGMTSWISLLFAEEPAKAIKLAREKLLIELKQIGG
jgi:hypothetical protein